MKRLFPILVGALAAACMQDETLAPDAAPTVSIALTESLTMGPAARRTIFGIDESNTLVSFRPTAPQQLLSVTPITGLPAGERIFAIDFRPGDGSLIGIGTASRLYRIDPATGASTALGSNPFSPALAGRHLGVDFNPTVDRVRVHSDAEQNLRLHPDLGTVVAVDTMLTFEAGDANAGITPDVVAAAYTNSALNGGVPPTSTMLFALDQRTRSLVLLPAPNGGRLRTVGGLGVPLSRAAGFDIATQDNIAFASLNTGGGRTGLYRINLATGAASRVGDIGHREVIIGISVQP